METIYIPLGKDCCFAYQLQKLGLRRHAYPFDWLSISDIGNIDLCILNNFSNFIDEEYLVSKGFSNNFSHIEDKWEDNLEDNKYDMNKMRHKLYKFEFKHDFNKNYDLLKIKKKYERRIIRFYDIMKSADKKVLLLMDKKKHYHKIDHLIETMNSKGFINYSIKFISYEELPATHSWQRNEFNWNKWILN